MIRPRRILAIARADLATELSGRQGLLLPAVVAGLLLPAATVPSPVQGMTRNLEEETVRVYGDVPPGVLEAEAVSAASRLKLEFTQQEDVLLVDGLFIPPSVREKLDEHVAAQGDGATVPVEVTPRGFRFPGRTALLALISASTLTGAVSQSIGGERQRKTLVVLLAAAITRAEIVLGKWAAWGGLGAGSALVGACVALLLGHTEPGAWLVPLPTVPLATVALGLWLVRRAGDVMAGSATALRVLPAALSLAAVIAWLLGDRDPWLGALVPLGGALLAAGQTWPELGPTLLAAVSTLCLAAFALAATVRDLEESPDREPPQNHTMLALAVGTLAAVAWWLPVAGPELWSMAGNPKVNAALPVQDGVMAGTLALVLFSLVRVARSHDGALNELHLRPKGWKTPAVALVAVAGLLGASLLDPVLPPLGYDEVHTRLASALYPRWAGLGLATLTIVADELLFRGWLQRAVGPTRAVLVWTAVKTPLDPISGLLSGVVCAGAAAVGGSVWPALLARLLWLWVVGSALP
jgi:hypothetical protein